MATIISIYSWLVQRGLRVCASRIFSGLTCELHSIRIMLTYMLLFGLHLVVLYLKN